MAQLVFAQQDMSNTYRKKNDLVVTNNADYQDAGICVGPGGAFNNMRLAYSLPDAAGSITTDTLNIHVEQLYFKNLASATLVPKPYNYVVMDVSGNVKEGFPHYQGDLNSTMKAVQDDVLLLKQTLGLPINQVLSTQTLIGYLSIGLIVLLIILVIVLFVRFSRILPHAIKGGKGSGAVAAAADQATKQAQQAAALSMLQPLPSSFSAPSFSAPSFSAPSFSAPSFSAPSFSAPSYSVPSYSVPSFSAPSFSAPSFSAPSFSAPASYSGSFSGPYSVPSFEP